MPRIVIRSPPLNLNDGLAGVPLTNAFSSASSCCTRIRLTLGICVTRNWSRRRPAASEGTDRVKGRAASIVKTVPSSRNHCSEGEREIAGCETFETVKWRYCCGCAMLGGYTRSSGASRKPFRRVTADNFGSYRFSAPARIYCPVRVRAKPRVEEPARKAAELRADS